MFELELALTIAHAQGWVERRGFPRQPTEVWSTNHQDHRVFEGHEPRSCGEHRTVGGRAWCFDDTEWCYPSAGMECRGCECAG